MASRQQIKQRIGSVKNTKQITKAMQLVAASKLRRAQDTVAGPREFSRVAREMLTHLRQLSSQDATFQLYTQRPVKKRLLVVIASDRTLAGAYNVNIVRRLLQEVSADRANHVQTQIICVGRQVAHAAARISGLEIIGAYQDFPDKPTANHIRPILKTILERFIDGQADAVDMIYTHFRSTVTQEVTLQKLLPAGFEAEAAESPEINYATIEPSLDELLHRATERLLEAQMYQALLDAVASEHSMRMLAMKNATDNASDLIDDLTLEYNNARQAAITQELAEITGGAEAMK